MTESEPKIMRALRRFSHALSDITLGGLPSVGPDIVPAPPTVEGVQEPARFGNLIVQRRGELGLTQGDVHAAGGPSDLTLRKLERAETVRPDAATLSKLDKALRWAPGSASRAFQGGEPTPLPDTATSSAAAWTKLRPPMKMFGLDQGVVLRTDALADLTRCSSALDVFDAAAGLDAEQLQRVADLRAFLDRIIRAWIMRQAEVARAAGEVSDLVIALDDHLRSTPRASDPTDIEDLRYLRWLVDYEASPPFTAEELGRFEQRFDASRPEL